MIPVDMDVVSEEDRRNLDIVKNLIDSDYHKRDFIALRDMAVEKGFASASAFNKKIDMWNSFNFDGHAELIKTAILWLYHNGVDETDVKAYADKYLNNEICNMLDVDLKGTLIKGVADMKTVKADFTFDDLFRMVGTVECSVVHYYQTILILLAKRRLKEDLSYMFCKMVVENLIRHSEAALSVSGFGCSLEYADEIKSILIEYEQFVTVHEMLENDVDDTVIEKMTKIADNIVERFMDKCSVNSKRYGSDNE